MAPTVNRLGALLLIGTLPALGNAGPPAAGPTLPDFGGQPVSLEAAGGSDIDLKTNTLVFRNVVISQGAMRVSADHARATGLNFANSRWNFEGNVRINAEQRGKLRSDQAIVDFRDGHIARATITGKPAEFEQQRANSEQLARGHADEIVYDLSYGTVRLSNDAWLCDGQEQISGPLLVYNIREQQIQAGGRSDQPVHISIVPHPAKPASAGCDMPQAEAPAAAKPALPPAPAAEPAPKS